MEPNVFDYFYDGQIRRIILQFMRIFSLIKVRSGPDENGIVSESTVPIRYGDSSRMVEAIRNNNSENSIPSSTIMAAYITNIQQNSDRRQNPWYEDTLRITEREFVNGEYTSNVGNKYTIQRPMPTPYKITFNLDIWTTTTTTKLQILEQILMIFNPSVSIQHIDNPLDWTALFDVELDQNIPFTNRSIGSQVESDRDIITLTFYADVHITAPALLQKQRIIEQIVANLYDYTDEKTLKIAEEKLLLDYFNTCFDKIEQFIITPENLRVKIGTESVNENELLLLDESGAIANITWIELFEKYGKFDENRSFITLKTSENIEDNNGDIIGKIKLNPTNPHVLTFTIDESTLPSTILGGPITKIINPLNEYPGNGLPIAAIGQRYLLKENIPFNTGLNPWGSVNGKENDIIEYNGNSWFVSFDSQQTNNIEYVRSLSSLNHYKFINNTWVHTYFGEYSPGYWKITLQGKN